MAEIDPVVLELIAKNDRYVASLANSQRVAEQRLGNIERAGGQMSTNLSRSFDTAGRAALAFAGAFVTLGAARELLRIADSAKQLEAQLRLATSETGNFSRAQDDVRRIASETRTSLEATAQLYGTFQRNARELGISQEEAARATETVTKTFRISGATAAEAAGGLRQFLQGLQSGALRGEELNSVLENAPRLARLLADGLGVTVGQLRELGQAGDLAADRLISALTDRKFTASIDAEFSELPVTFEDAMTQIENAAIITFGAFDRGGDFSRMLATFVADGAAGFEDLEQSALETGIDIRSTFEGLADVFDPMLTAAQSIFGQIGGEAQSLADRIRPLLGEIDAISGWLSQQGVGGALLTGNSISDWQNGTTSGTSLLQTFNRGQAASEMRRRNEIAVQSANDVFRGYDNLGNRTTRSLPARTSGGGGAAKPRGRSAESAAKKAENDRLRQIREEAAAQRELAGLDDDIIAAKAALATAANDILQFELDQVDREKDARIAQFQTDFDLSKLSEQEFADRKAKVEEIASLDRQRILLARQEADAAAAALQQQNAARDNLATLETESRLARTREERAEIEQQLLDAAYRMEEDAIRQASANGEIANLDEALANMRRRRLADEELFARQNMSPGERYLDDLQYEAENLSAAYENIAVNGLERMNRAFSDNIKSALGLHGVLGDIIGDLIELALRQQILNIAGGGSGGGLLGGLVGAIGGIFGGGGGPVNLLAGTPFGRAGGGFVAPGQTVRVNEHRGGAEYLRMGSQGGTVIPLGASGPIGREQAAPQAVTVRLALSGDLDAKIDQRSAGVAVEVFRAGAPDVVNAAVNETYRRSGRGKM